MVTACIFLEGVRDRGANGKVAVVNASIYSRGDRDRGPNRKVAAVDVCTCVFIFYDVFALFRLDPALAPTYRGLDCGLVRASRILFFCAHYAVDPEFDPTWPIGSL